MRQKTNPISFNSDKNTNIKYKYFEKKSSELQTYNFKNVEIRKFVHKFFESYGLTVHDVKLSYSGNTINIFISYVLTLKTVFLINSSNKTQKVKLIKNQNKKKRYKKIQKNIKRYIKYKNFSTHTSNNKKVQKLQRVKFLKYHKKHLLIKKYDKLSKIKTNFFLIKFFESLNLFTNHKTDISITLKQLNVDIKQKINKKNIKILKKNLIKLRKYKQNKFFKEGINILFLSTIYKTSAFLLANFIANQLTKLKKHNFFLRFIKNTLILFNTQTFSKLKGIKIKVKGRFNKAPRARHKIITIGNGVPTLTINSKIDYAETISFTPNGTFGVKVWVYEN